MIKCEFEGLCSSITICAMTDGLGLIVESLYGTIINRYFEVI